MARIAVSGTQSASGGHGAGKTTPGAESPHVYISFDNAVVTSFSTFKNIVMGMLKVLEGSNEFTTK